MYRIVAIISSVALSLGSLGFQAATATAVPVLPYMPPTEVHIIDLLHNAYGLTIPQIEDDATRLRVYYDTYRAIMGSSYEQFKEELDDLVQDARNSRQIKIGAAFNGELNTVFKQIMASGYTYQTGGESVEGLQELVAWCQEAIGGEMVDALTSSMLSNNAQANGVTGEYHVVIWGSDSQDWANNRGNIAVLPIGVDFELRAVTQWQNDIYFGNMSNIHYIRVAQTTLYPDQTANLPMQYQRADTTAIDSNAAQYETKGVTVLDAAVQAVLNALKLIPITANTVIENGEIDETLPIIIDLPSALPLPADDLDDLDDVLQKLGTVPVTDNIEDTVQELQDVKAATVGDTDDFKLGLRYLFPFCLPWDAVALLHSFEAEPQAPSFSYTINNPFSDDPEDDITLSVDLAMFDDVAAVLRTLESILFVVGLCVVTRSLYLRG